MILVRHLVYIEPNTNASKSISPIMFSIVLAVDTIAKHTFSKAMALISQMQKITAFI